MAGHSAKEAKAAYRAKNPRPPRPATNSTPPSSSVHVATPSTIVPVLSPSPAPPSIPIIVNGISYIPDFSWFSNPSPSVPSAYITEIPSFSGYDYHAFLALPDKTDPFSALSALPNSSSPHKTIHSPFIIDSGAACHLSPNLLDFKPFAPSSLTP